MAEWACEEFKMRIPIAGGKMFQLWRAEGKMWLADRHRDPALISKPYFLCYQNRNFSQESTVLSLFVKFNVDSYCIA
jgi:hypothetical protein